MDETHDNLEFLGINPSELSMADAHRLLLHCVAPRPIAFVSTVSLDGVRNLAPFSYFMAGGVNPPSIAISPLTDRDGLPKDTLRNIVATGEFVISVVTYEMRDRMNYASAEFPYGVDEWVKAGFQPAKSHLVKPPRVQDSPLSMECRLFQVVSHGSGPLAANYVIGEVAYFHVCKKLMPDGVLDPREVDYVARMGGNWYSRANSGSMFEMERPPKVDKHP